LRAIKWRTVGIHQPQQFVAIRAGHHQHQLHIARPVHLVTRRFQRGHGGFARLAGERMLSFVDNQRHRFASGFIQRAQRIHQGQAIDLADFAGIDLQPAREADFLQPGPFGDLRHSPQLGQQSTTNGFCNQHARIAGHICPQIHIHHHNARLFQFGLQIAAQERGFAGAARRSQKEAIVRITKPSLALQGGDQLLG